MGDRESQDHDIRTLLRDARRLEPSAPPFERLWRRAHQKAYPTPRRQLVPAITAVLVFGLGVWFFTSLRSVRREAEIESLMASVRHLQTTPLDFLLETPGTHFLQQTPRFGDAAREIDPSLLQLLEE